MEEQRIYTVTGLNQHIKQLLDGDDTLQGLCVQGELSNYKIYPSGHHYFTLGAAHRACVSARRAECM